MRFLTANLLTYPLQQYVPFVFSNSDNASLQSIFISRLEEYGSPKPRKKNGASTDAPFILGSEHIATPKFLQTAMDALQPYIHQRARQELQQEKKMHSARGKKKLNSEISAKLSTKEASVYKPHQGCDCLQIIS